MDSCVAAAIARRDNRVAFLHIRYGQRTAKRELKAFTDIADFYEADLRLVVSLDYLKEIGGSALTDERLIVPLHTEGPEVQTRGIPETYVPFRNAHLLSIAVSWGETIGATRIYIGAVEEDSSGYPDCREVFYRAFNKAVKAGTKPETRLEIVTPLIYMKKAGIVRKGIELGAPLHLTWSCYKDGEIACGKCDSCLLRLKGFKGAGAKDTLPYHQP